MDKFLIASGGPLTGELRISGSKNAGLPLLAAMRPQSDVAVVLERGGLRLRRRSPLAAAARRVLTVVHQHPGVNAA